MSFKVDLSLAAQEDLLRIFDTILRQELQRSDGDFDRPDTAVAAIMNALRVLERHPFTCRKVGSSPFWRELVINFGRTGFVAQFEILGEANILVAAVRHPREDDYH